MSARKKGPDSNEDAYTYLLMRESHESFKFPHIPSLALIIGVWNDLDGALMIVSNAANTSLQEYFALPASANRDFGAFPALRSWRSRWREIGVTDDMNDISSILSPLRTQLIVSYSVR